MFYNWKTVQYLSQNKHHTISILYFYEEYTTALLIALPFNIVVLHSYQSKILANS